MSTPKRSCPSFPEELQDNMDSIHSRRSFLAATCAVGIGTAISFKSTSIPAQDALARQARELDPFIHYDATGLAELVKARKVSPAELAEVFIRRIEALNPLINRIATQTFDRARK